MASAGAGSFSAGRTRLRLGRWALGPGWLPTDDDNTFVVSLMAPAHEPGRMASWIAPPASGIHQKPVDYDYVRA